MKRYLLSLMALLLVMPAAWAHADLITSDGSFETSGLVSGGYNGTMAWHTDGFVRMAPGGSDGDHFAAAVDPNPGDWQWPQYTLFQVTPFSWSSGRPAAGESTVRLAFDYKKDDAENIYSNLVVAVRGSDTAPSAGASDPNDFGVNVFTPPQYPLFGSDAMWSTLDQTFTGLAPFDYYTIYIVAANADVDNMQVYVTGALPVPLPASVLLLGPGLLGLAGLRRRMRPR